MAGRHDANLYATSRAAANACAWGAVRVPERVKGALMPVAEEAIALIRHDLIAA
jgi:hypothetical protein